VKIFQRLSIIFFSLILSVLSLLVVLYAAGLERPVQEVISFALRDLTSRWITGIVGAGILFLSLYNLVKIFTTDRRIANTEHIFIGENKLGQVSMSVNALENIVIKAARQVEGVREAKPKIKSTPEGVAIYLRTVVTPAVSIPEVSEELQNKIKERVRHFAGLDAVEIRVFVENVAQDVKAGRC